MSHQTTDETWDAKVSTVVNVAIKYPMNIRQKAYDTIYNLKTIQILHGCRSFIWTKIQRVQHLPCFQQEWERSRDHDWMLG